MTQQIVALNQRPVSKQANRVVASVTPPAPAEVVAVPKPVEVAEAPPKNDLYYSVRVASGKSKIEISKASKKFEKQCGHIETEFNSKLNRHILYCGKFQDLESAELFFQKLNVNGKLIVHRSPAAL